MGGIKMFHPGHKYHPRLFAAKLNQFQGNSFNSSFYTLLDQSHLTHPIGFCGCLFHQLSYSLLKEFEILVRIQTELFNFAG
jgi:hypothetical protein